MEVIEALALESLRLRRRIAVEHRGLRHIAPHEAHAFAVLEVNCRKDNHGRHFKKLEIK